MTAPTAEVERVAAALEAVAAGYAVPAGTIPKAAALLRLLAKDAEAGRALWTHLIETRDAWGEYQDTFVELGLLERVAIPKNMPSEGRCEDCDGDCDWCYQPTDLLAAGRKEGDEG